MAAHPVFTDDRGVEDFWQDVKKWLRHNDRDMAWLARRVGPDAAALCRMAQGQKHTPVDLALAIAGELGPHVLDSMASRTGLMVERATFDRWTTRNEDANRAIAGGGRLIAVLAQKMADGDLSADELEEAWPALVEQKEQLEALLAHRRPDGPRAVPA